MCFLGPGPYPGVLDLWGGGGGWLSIVLACLHLMLCIHGTWVPRSRRAENIWCWCVILWGNVIQTFDSLLKCSNSDMISWWSATVTDLSFHLLPMHFMCFLEETSSFPLPYFIFVCVHIHCSCRKHTRSCRIIQRYRGTVWQCLDCLLEVLSHSVWQPTPNSSRFAYPTHTHTHVQLSTVKCSFWVCNVIWLFCSPSAVCVSAEVMYFLLLNPSLKSLSKWESEWALNIISLQPDWALSKAIAIHISWWCLL